MSVARNLLIVHNPGRQELSDWSSIKRIINERAPDIEVHIATNDGKTVAVLPIPSGRPTLTFSPSRLRYFVPPAGKVYCGKKIGKFEQVRILQSAGVPVPPTVILIPGLALNKERWGDYVVVKPDFGGHGSGVSVARTDEVGLRTLALRNRPGWRGQFIVQKLIDQTDERGRPTDYRAMMVFGTPIYVHKRRWTKRQRPLEEMARELSGEIASNSLSATRHREFCFDQEVIELAKLASKAFHEIPVLGVDIARDRTSGRLYIFEVNPGGTVWHLSSDLAKKQFPAEFRRAGYKQFNALETVAELLIERTRIEAC